MKLPHLLKRWIAREYIYILVFCTVFLFFIIATPFTLQMTIKLGNNYYADKSQAIAKKFKDRSQEILAQAHLIGKNPELIQAIKDNDQVNVLSLLNEAKEQYKINVGATNSQGVVISRTINSTRRGDNLFLTTYQGKAVAAGKEVATIEDALSIPLSMVSAYPLKENGKIIGGIFAGLPLDDTFAQKTKEENNISDLVFYTPTLGVESSSIQNPLFLKNIEQIFAPGSEWIKNHKTNSIITLPDKSSYYIQNIVFPGLERSPGGMILFYKFNVLRVYIFSEIVSLILLVIIFFSIKKIFNKKFKAHKHSVVVHLAVVSLITVTIVYITLSFTIKSQITTITKPSFAIYNSTLQFSPSMGIFTYSQDQRVAINVTSGGESINGFDVKIHYDPSVINVNDIDITKSICPKELFVDKKIDNVKGTIEVSCVLFSPGFNDKNGVIAELVISHKKPGAFSLNFDPSSQILANDGLGTNVLRYSEDGSYTTVADNDIHTLLAYSLTHPNSEIWYNDPNVSLTWQSCQDCIYKYVVNSDLNFYDPVELQLTGKEGLRTHIPHDGIYYIHLQKTDAENATSSTAYKIKIDTTPPVAPTINVDTETPQVNKVVRFHFDSSDATSGLQYNYYIKFDNETFLPTRADLYSSFDTSGAHTVTVRVYDLAGNYNETVKTLNVQ